MVKVSRKYDTLTKYLRSVIGNEALSQRTRMQAAETLNSIYSRHEHYTERAAQRAERSLARKMTIEQGTPVPVIPHTQTQDAEDHDDTKLTALYDSFLPGRRTGIGSVAELADDVDE